MNEVINGRGFYISYNPAPGAGFPLFKSDNGDSETALVDENCKVCNGNHFYILNGDFRKEYKEVVSKGLKECLKIYKANKSKFDSTWTTNH